jgi:hypothetical protein
MKDVVTNSWEETEYYLDIQYVAHTAHINSLQVKGKAILLQAWKGPHGSKRLRLLDFKTIST